MTIVGLCACVFSNALLVLTKIYIWSPKDASKQQRIRQSYEISPGEIVERGEPQAVKRIGLGEPLGNNSFSGMTISFPWEFTQSVIAWVWPELDLVVSTALSTGFLDTVSTAARRDPNDHPSALLVFSLLFRYTRLISESKC